ncbi:uncharacterized protein LOC105696116 [Orussus abietinus]|uniref:uncharacterized protein LOC105696116 n=1 Tax=Orussus abietinus TaxID=222816 RepID=UPI000626CDAF|nr:uncharacterized protein LOC105696116 [Orussus abietinus]XP_012273735.1 uncharacterized protein LOC105696116 [Orussus abietinus]XP_023287575.1 uncharacterized protein LOC105696116 [Orussus abietinus]
MMPREPTRMEEEIWSIYAWWGSVLVLQLMTLTWITGRIRVKRKVIHSEEDKMWFTGSDVILCPTGGGHPEVDHVREGHRNDIEIIVTFLLIVPIWLSTNPSFHVAKTLLRCFPISKILHTALYMNIFYMKEFYQTILLGIAYCILGYIISSCVIFSFL